MAQKMIATIIGQTSEPTVPKQYTVSEAIAEGGCYHLFDNRWKETHFDSFYFVVDDRLIRIRGSHSYQKVADRTRMTGRTLIKTTTPIDVRFENVD